MIQLTRLNKAPIVINSDLIEHIDVTPDTVVILTSGEKFLVLESASQVVGKVLDFRRSIIEGLPLCQISSAKPENSRIVTEVIASTLPKA
jgi:flagellar protein FlbD